MKTLSCGPTQASGVRKTIIPVFIDHKVSSLKLGYNSDVGFVRLVA